MTPIAVLTDPDNVSTYLAEHNLLDGYAPIEAVMCQPNGTVRGHTAVLIVIDINGKRVLAKTTLALLDGALTMLQAAEQRERNTDEAIRARSVDAFTVGRDGQEDPNE